MHHGDFVLECRLLRELRVELHVRLGVVIDQFYLFADQAAGSIGFLDGERQSIDHRLAIAVEPAREVVNACDADRIVRKCARTEHPASSGSGRTLYKSSAIRLQCLTPRRCRYVMMP